MVGKGIAAERLVPKGFGPDKPLVPKGEKGAADKNRRVELTILERSDKKAETPPPAP